LRWARVIWTRDASRVIAPCGKSYVKANGCAVMLLTGFPWNAFGYALTEPLALAQDGRR